MNVPNRLGTRRAVSCGATAGPRPSRRPPLAASSEGVNLSISAIFDMSQINDLARPKTAKFEFFLILSG
ncbi:protein of unknown function [Bradyrhizobium sp. ORS 285]|nr:protein of unknown function [Bradyrhizobium sp. ORS 285]